MSKDAGVSLAWSDKRAEKLWAGGEARRLINKQMKESLLKVGGILQRNWQRDIYKVSGYKKRTGKLKESFNLAKSLKVTGNKIENYKLVFMSNLAYAEALETGATIKAKKTFLAWPTTQAMKEGWAGKSAKEFFARYRLGKDSYALWKGTKASGGRGGIYLYPPKKGGGTRKKGKRRKQKWKVPLPNSKRMFNLARQVRLPGRLGFLQYSEKYLSTTGMAKIRVSMNKALGIR